MKCRICGSQADFVFEAKVLRKYNVKYFFCPVCEFLQTEEPYWLDEAYREPVTVYDTGYLARNISLSRQISVLLFILFNRNGRYVDYGGGLGVFVRLMRDIGFDFYWYDKYAQNLFAKGFEWDFSGKADAVTCIEVFEHFVEPIKEIENMLGVSRNIIFTTELLPIPIPKPEDWWYYAFDEGQHISFYTKKTLNFISYRYNLNYYKVGNIHIFTEKKFSPMKLKIVNLFMKLTKVDLYRLFTLAVKNKTFEDMNKFISKV